MSFILLIVNHFENILGFQFCGVKIKAVLAEVIKTQYEYMEYHKNLKLLMFKME